MSLSDCVHCWDTPCTCGWEYRNWSIEALEKHVAILNKVLFFKRKSADPQFSDLFGNPETEDDKRLMEFLRQED